MTLKKYIERLDKYLCPPFESHFDKTHYVAAYIYINRLHRVFPGLFSSLSAHRIVLTALTLAQKMADRYYGNSHCAATGGISCDELNNLEVEFLLSISFYLFITSEQYETAHQELWQYNPKTKLHTLVNSNQVELFHQAYSNFKFPIDMPLDENGRTALYAFASCGSLAGIELVLKLGANINARSLNGATAIMKAAANGHTDVVKFLLNQTPAPNLSISLTNIAGNAANATALHYAAENGHATCCRLLLMAGAPISAQTALNKTAADSATGEAVTVFTNTDIIAEFLTLTGTKYSLPEQITQFIEAGMQLTLPDNKVNFLMQCIAIIQKSHSCWANSITKHLLVRLINSSQLNTWSSAYQKLALPIDTPLTDDDYTALHLFTQNNNKEGTKLALNLGANINAQTTKCKTPEALAYNSSIKLELCLARMKQLLVCNDAVAMLDIVITAATELRYHDKQSLLKDFIAELTPKQRDEFIPQLQLKLVLSGKTDLFSVVISDLNYSIDSPLDDEQHTALHLFVKQNNWYGIQAALQLYANANAVDGDGNTSLHLAAIAGQNNSCQRLIQLGACPSALNNQGKTPLEVATGRAQAYLSCTSPIIAVIERLQKQCDSQALTYIKCYFFALYNPPFFKKFFHLGMLKFQETNEPQKITEFFEASLFYLKNYPRSAVATALQEAVVKTLSASTS